MARQPPFCSSFPLTVAVILAEWPRPALPQPPGWEIDYVDVPRLFSLITGRSVAIDAGGHPHMVYGEDHLYHAWHDGSARRHSRPPATIRSSASLIAGEIAFVFPA